MAKTGHTLRHSRNNGLASAISGAIAGLSLVVVAVTFTDPVSPSGMGHNRRFLADADRNRRGVSPRGIAALRGPGRVWGVVGLVLAAVSLAGLIILQLVAGGSCRSWWGGLERAPC